MNFEDELPPDNDEWYAAEDTSLAGIATASLGSLVIMGSVLVSEVISNNLVVDTLAASPGILITICGVEMARSGAREIKKLSTPK